MKCGMLASLLLVALCLTQGSCFSTSKGPMLGLLVATGFSYVSPNVMLKNVSETLERLINGYDIRLRPKFGGEPLVVDIDVIIASFDSISEVNMDYTITMYLNQYWRDDRLEYGDPHDQMTLTGDFAEKIWVPDTFFANDKKSFLHKVTESNKMLRLSGDGSIAYGMRFTTTLACMMDLHYYPLDIQNCTVEIESYGYPMEDVEMRWRVGRKSIVGVDNVDLPQFEFEDYDTQSTMEELASGNYQRLSLSFLLRRHIGYFVFQTFLPSILIVMLSWVSFWINHEATSARVALGITTVLTMTTISTGVRASLPRISYVKAIDIYLVMCFVFVFAALLEYAAVNYFFWGARAKKKGRSKSKTNPIPPRDLSFPPNTTYTMPQAVPAVWPQQQGTTYTSTPEYHGSMPQPNGRSHNGEERKLNDSGEIELDEVHDMNNTGSYPAVSDGEGDAMLRTNHRITNNNNGDYPVNPDQTPRLRRPGFMVKGTNPRNRKVWVSIRQRAKDIKSKIPQVKDVNNIDKYSRLVFPLLFIIFNAWYWVYYSVLSHRAINANRRG